MGIDIEKTSAVSKNYAEALIDLVKSGKINQSQLIFEIEAANTAFKESKDLNSVIANPTFTNEIKTEIISAIFKDKVSPEILNFLNILMEKNRINELPNIYTEFKHKLNEKNNTQPVNIISAVDLNDVQKSRIVDTLTRKLNKTILPCWQIDRSIIAGLIVKIYDNVIDMSLKGRIDRLGKCLMIK